MSEHSLLKFVNYYFCITRFYSVWRFSRCKKIYPYRWHSIPADQHHDLLQKLQAPLADRKRLKLSFSHPGIACQVITGTLQGTACADKGAQFINFMFSFFFSAKQLFHVLFSILIKKPVGILNKQGILPFTQVRINRLTRFILPAEYPDDIIPQLKSHTQVHTEIMYSPNLFFAAA